MHVQAVEFQLRTERAGIRTTENLIFTPLPTLLSFLQDQPHIGEYDIQELTERCLRLTAPTSKTGWEEIQEYEQEREGRRWTGWGTEGLDGLIGDWDGVGVVEICGTQRTGKSVSLSFECNQIIDKEDAAREGRSVMKERS